LTVAGSDSGGGAGIQADLKVITLLGGYGSSVVTALTAQNTLGVQDIFDVSPDFVQKQMAAVLSDIGADAVKTGMLSRGDIISRVARQLKKYRLKKLVVDPVMVSQSGHPLLQDEAVETLVRDLFPLAGLVTPNLSEASRLVGFPIRHPAAMKKAARRIKERTGGAVLIKGGHLEGPALDLFFDGQHLEEISAPRIPTPHTHGTGCSYSAAITTFWGQGKSLPEAVREGKTFIQRAIRAGRPLGQGQGPTDPYGWIETALARYPALLELDRAAVRLKEAGIGGLIPEVQSNFGYALPYAETPDEVAAFPGRLVRMGAGIAVLGFPAFGASRHVARIILTVMRFHPEYRSAMNIRFEEGWLKAARRLGFRLGGFDRREEPPGVKLREGSSLSWGVGRVLEKMKGLPDLIFDRGDAGKEPMIRVLGRDPQEVTDKIMILKKGLL
jgi:hydroxymethylpyrimidine kinase/phosphomethylpyrimidine kinase